MSQPATTLEQARQHHAQGNLLHAAESYRLAIQSDPQSQPALLGLSLIARQTQQLQPALTMAKAALAANRNSALAWANCGDVLLALNETALAQSAFQQALTLNPDLAAAYFGLGHLAALKEDFPAARSLFEQAIRHAPHSAESHFALGFTYARLGEHAQAIRHYRRALQLSPKLASAWLNLGVALIADGQDNIANIANVAYRQAILNSQQSPQTQISAHLNLGHLARSHRHFQQAQQHYESALAIAKAIPAANRLAEIHVAFAYLHLEQNHFPSAWQSLREAEKSDPQHQSPEIPNATGILLLAEEMWVPQVPNLEPGRTNPGLNLIEEAIQSFTEAESRGHKTAPSNRGNALLRQGRIAEALQAHQKAVALDPHHPGARYNLALTQLRDGNFREGWQNYEIRWQFREVHPRPRRFHQPRWQGEPLPPGSTLLIYSEQGLGDTLQFLRYLPKVAQRTPLTPLILEVQPPLVRLLTQCAAQIHPHGQPLPPFTHHIPLLSLPALLQTTPETIPNQIPYLHADPALVQQRAAELATLDKGNVGAPSFAQPRSPATGFGRWGGWAKGGKPQIPKIGLNWAGNPHYRADRERSTTIQTLIPLLEIPNIHWISLQHGPAATQIRQLPASLTLHNLSEADRDLTGTAALIAYLDLVITTDTAIAHLAGALGKPLWLLLPWQSDWRWMQQIPTTHWYPQARLFRQSQPNNWPELIHRVAAELHKSGCPTSRF